MIDKLKKYPMYYNNVKQTYPDIKPGISFLSRTVIVGNIVVTSGFDGRTIEIGSVSSDKLSEQLTTCLDNTRFALEEAGSSMNNLFKMTISLKNFNESPVIWKTMLEYYQKYAPELVKEPPVISIIGVIDLAKPECQIEIDSMAVISKDEPGWEMRKYPMYVGNIPQTYPNIDSGQPFFSESATVGNLIFLSSMSGENPNTGEIETDIFEEQMHTALDKVRSAMDTAGSSMNNVIKTLHCQTGLEWLLKGSEFTWHTYSPASDRLWKSELEYYDRYAPSLLDEFPASTFLKVPSLSNPKALGQVEVTGVISKFRPGWKIKNYPCYLAKRGFPHHIGDIKKYYANSVVTGNLIFLSGACPFDPDTGGFETTVFEEQMWIALDSLRAAMEETGSSLENLVKTNILLPNPDNLASMRKIELEYYQKYAPSLVDEPPASSVIHLLNLATPKLLIELDAIGFLPDN
jgi:2-iminobutanoate/2-iminopropanoate deaminase